MDIRRMGKPGGTPIVALHGIQGTRDSWRHVAQALGDDYEFILPNLPGRGAAAYPASQDECRLEAFAAVLERVIEREVDGRRYVLAGWSMGVSVVLHYLSRSKRAGRGTDPAAVILISGSAQLRDLRWFKSERPAELLAEIKERETRLGLVDAADPTVVASTWNALKHTCQMDELAQIAAPTLVVHGSEDEDCPLEHAYNMLGGLHRGALHVLPGAKHSVLTQNSQQVGEAIHHFLRDKSY
jgi:pimeloyl-ACP methyl ester carboxylesterase